MMAKRIGDKSRPIATDDAIVATEAEDVGADDDTRGGGDGGSNDANSSHPSEPKPSLWDEVQHSLSELIPLISRPENLLATVLASGVDEHDAGDADSPETTLANNREIVRVHPARQQLLVTSQQIFRYIEYLASMEVKLKELQRQQKASRADAAIGGSRHEMDEDGVKSSGAEEDCNNEPCSLSGLSSLYTGNHQSNTINNDDATCVVDAETIWGQVDLQNQVLMSRLKKMIKKLSKRVGSSNNDDDDDENVLRILHTNGSMIDSDDEGEDEGDDGDEEMSQGSAASNYELKGEDDEGEGSDENDYDSDEENDDDDNDERRHIRDRMEKAMAEMSDDEEDIMGQDKEAEDDNNIIELFSKSPRRKTQTMEDDSDTDVDTNHEDTLDPTREDLRDGFFDLHEMEAFADEEEEMLPDDAYGEEDPEDDAMEAKKGKGKKKAILPHVRDRLGIDSEDDGDDVENEGSGDEDDDPLSKRFQPTSVRRKKYRADDEVEALCE
jgi:hypothetical protein